MKGHIRERSPGHWAIVIDVRDPQTGKRKRRWHSFTGNKRQAQVECAKLIAEIKNGTALDPAKVTLAGVPRALVGPYGDPGQPQVSRELPRGGGALAKYSAACGPRY
jgi:hypothetical protein